MNPFLIKDNLLGSVSYVDLQMEDVDLSQWLLHRAKSLGVEIKGNTSVENISVDGSLNLSDGDSFKYDKIVNACGPWALELLEKSNISSPFHLFLIRGSHIIINRTINIPIVIQVLSDRRIVFALPLDEGKTLVGTTEVTQTIAEPIICSDSDLVYLTATVNQVFSKKLQPDEILFKYSGIRPIVSLKQSINSLSKLIENQLSKLTTT
jgi:glycerol-3-phosphate dehydrogenase